MFADRPFRDACNGAASLVYEPRIDLEPRWIRSRLPLRVHFAHQLSDN